MALHGGDIEVGTGVVSVGNVNVVIAVNSNGRVRAYAVGGMDGRGHPRACLV